MVWIAVRQHLRRIQELLIAHVALAAAEEDVRTHLPLNALVTAEDTVNLAHDYTFLSLNSEADL